MALTGSSVPSRDRSLELTNYPTDMLHSPPQTLEAAVTFKAAPPGTVAGGEPATDRRRRGRIARREERCIGAGRETGSKPARHAA